MVVHLDDNYSSEFNETVCIYSSKFPYDFILLSLSVTFMQKRKQMEKIHQYVHDVFRNEKKKHILTKLMF